MMLGTKGHFPLKFLFCVGGCYLLVLIGGWAAPPPPPGYTSPPGCTTSPRGYAPMQTPYPTTPYGVPPGAGGWDSQYDQRATEIQQQIAHHETSRHAIMRELQTLG
eukprot:gene12462-biopygen7581